MIGTCGGSLLSPGESSEDRQSFRGVLQTFLTNHALVILVPMKFFFVDWDSAGFTVVERLFVLVAGSAVADRHGDVVPLSAVGSSFGVEHSPFGHRILQT